MNRIPIRLRLTLASAFATVTILAFAGLLVYRHLHDSLDGAVDQSLKARASDVAALVQQADSGLQEQRPQPGLAEPADAQSQILTASGAVLDRSPGSPKTPLLRGPELQRGLRSPVFLTRPPGAADGHSLRLLAVPVHAQDSRLVVVVGSSLEPRDDALATLRGELLLALAAATLLLVVLGYVITGAALRPVRSLRRAADQIGQAPTSVRLPLPQARDELRDLAGTLNTMLDRLGAAARRERAFVADASHELRTPLAVLAGELELAGRPHRTRAEIDESLAIASEECARLARLAEDLLLLARASAGELLVAPAPFDARALLERTARRFQQRAELSQRDVVVESPADLTLLVDADRVQQAVDNLVDNALRHGEGTVTLTARDEHDAAVVEVSDEGAGFSESFAPHAHERFTRADGARGRAGAGLGLAITTEIAHAHGGTLVIGNAPDGGAVLSLRLPRAEVTPPEAPPTRGRPARPAGRRAARRAHPGRARGAG